MSDLRTKVIHLAYHRPDLREHLIPLVKQAADPVTQYREILLENGVERRDLDAYLPSNMSFDPLNEHLRDEALFNDFVFGTLDWDDLVLLSFEKDSRERGAVKWEASVLIPWELVAKLMLANTAGENYLSFASDLAEDDRFRRVVSQNIEVGHNDQRGDDIIPFLVSEDHLETEVFDERRGPLGDIENIVVERTATFDSRGLQLDFEGESVAHTRGR